MILLFLALYLSFSSTMWWSFTLIASLKHNINYLPLFLQTIHSLLIFNLNIGKLTLSLTELNCNDLHLFLQNNHLSLELSLDLLFDLLHQLRLHLLFDLLEELLLYLLSDLNSHLRTQKCLTIKCRLERIFIILTGSLIVSKLTHFKYTLTALVFYRVNR